MAATALRLDGSPDVRSLVRADPRVVWLPAEVADLVDRAARVRRDGEHVTGRAGASARMTSMADNGLTLHQGPRHRERLRARSGPRRRARADRRGASARPCDRGPASAVTASSGSCRPAAPTTGRCAPSRVGAWFMDYRNADGGLAQMCGNGTRVFAAYLRREGLVTDDEFAIATRAGSSWSASRSRPGSRRHRRLAAADPERAAARGFDAMVKVATATTRCRGCGSTSTTPNVVVAPPTAPTSPAST